MFKILLLFVLDDFSIVLERILEGSLLFNLIIAFHPIESIFEAKIFINSFLRTIPFSENKKSIVWLTIFSLSSCFSLVALVRRSSKINTKQIFNLSSINKMFNTSTIKPGFKRKIFFKKLPKILITKDTYKMGYGLMKKTSEKGIIRLVKVAAGVEQ